MKNFAVIGCPIEHSLSPMIHRLFAQQFSIRLNYKKILAPLDKFDSIVSAFQAQGGYGLNVTVPFKVDAFNFATDLSARARLAAAVNTLTFKGSQITGDNTDGFGLVRDLIVNLRFDIAGSRILILGAGGAVRGVLGPLLAHQPQHLVVANRTESKARLLADSFTHNGHVDAVGLSSLPFDGFDLVINATAASLSGQVPAIDHRIVQSAQLVYDMMYCATETVFMQWATSNGAENVHGGLGMLIEQAAESFRIWHNKSPDTKVVMAALQ